MKNWVYSIGLFFAVLWSLSVTARFGWRGFLGMGVWLAVCWFLFVRVPKRKIINKRYAGVPDTNEEMRRHLTAMKAKGIEIPGCPKERPRAGVVFEIPGEYIVTKNTERG